MGGVIYSRSEVGFWSNEGGWMSLETATIFTDAERFDEENVPLISLKSDAQWVRVEEANKFDDSMETWENEQ